MFRALASLGIAFLCLGPVHASASSHQVAFIYGTPFQFKNKAAEASRVVEPTNAQKVTQYAQQQRIAEEQTKTAELDLRRRIAQLEQLRSRYPNSPDLERSIAQLQDSLNKVIAAEAQINRSQTAWASTPHPPAETDAAVTAAAVHASQMRQIAAAAQASASQGSSMADKTIGELNRAAVVAKEPPAVAAKPPTPLAEDRANADILPEPPKPAQPEEPKSAGTVGPPVGASPDGGNPAPVPVPTPGEPPAGAAAGPPPSASPTAPTPPSAASSETAWFDKLRKGLLQYTVPGTMLWKVPSTVTVQIQGENATPSGPLVNQTGEATIKVARRMKVLVINGPNNPDEFIIAPQPDTTPEQYVPEDGPTIWHFSVTPRYTEPSQDLVVQAWVLYDDNTQRQLLPVYSKPVDVHIPSFSECLKRLFEGDPVYWLNYGLPGGAGFVFVSGVVVGIWKWLSKKKKTPKKKTRRPQPATGD